jgi:hypothetical protein
MGIELHDNGRYNARCDGCDTVEYTGTWSPQASQPILREKGWLKGYHIKTAQHYTWWCPKCKAENVA